MFSRTQSRSTTVTVVEEQPWDRERPVSQANLDAKGVRCAPTSIPKDSKTESTAVYTSLTVPIDVYPEPDISILKTRELDACFNGILRALWLNSGCMYNRQEMTFFYKSVCDRRTTDPANVLDYESEARYGTGPSMADQHIGVMFHRIAVRPVAYAIRSDCLDKSTNHLRSFCFQAKTAEMDEWDTLDERLRIPDLSKARAHFLEFVDADMFYTQFRLLQTGPSHANFLSFNIAGFEIHGYVEERAH